MPNLLQLAVFALEFSDLVRFTWPPPVVQQRLFGLLAPLAELLGYRWELPGVFGSPPRGLRPVEPPNGVALWQTTRSIIDGDDMSIEKTPRNCT